MKIDTARDESTRLRLLNIRFGAGDVPGVLATEGWLDGVSKPATVISESILKRLRLLKERTSGSLYNDSLIVHRPPLRKWRVTRVLAAWVMLATASLLVLFLLISDVNCVKKTSQSATIRAELFTRSENHVLHREELGQDVESAQFGQLVRLSVQLPSLSYCYLIGFNPASKPDDQTQLLYPSSESIPPELKKSFTAPPADSDYLPLTDGVGQQAYVLVQSGDPLPPFSTWRAERRDRLTWSQVKEPGAWAYFDGQIEQILVNSRDRAEAITIAPIHFRDRIATMRDSLKGTGVHVTAIAFAIEDK